MKRVGGPHHPMFEPALGLPACGNRLVRIFIFEVAQRKGDAIENLGALVDRFGAGPEQTAHFLRRFQVTLAIGAQQTPSIMEIGALANAGDDMVERPLFARRSEGYTSALQS